MQLYCHLVSMYLYVTVPAGMVLGLVALVVMALRMAPVWHLNSYLDGEGLGLVVAALFLLAEWDLDLVGLVPCPGFGLIDA